jgi:hypothetical protein
MDTNNTTATQIEVTMQQPQQPSDIPNTQAQSYHSDNPENKPNNKKHNRKFPGPSLQEQRDFLNGFNREEYYKKYVR